MTPRSSHACWSAGGRNAPDERNRRKWPPSWRWTLPKRRRRIATGRCRPIAPEPIERGRPAPLLDLALDGAPEQVEHLGHDDHRGHPVVAEGIEDDPRVPAPDVQDVGPDVERVVQPDRLLEQVRERQERDEPVLHRRDDPVEALDRGHDVVVGQHDALRRAGRAGREDQLERLVRPPGGPTPPWRTSQSGGKSGSSGSGSAERASTVVVGKPVRRGLARVGRVAAGAQDEVAGARGLRRCPRPRRPTCAGRAGR